MKRRSLGRPRAAQRNVKKHPQPMTVPFPVMATFVAFSAQMNALQLLLPSGAT